MSRICLALAEACLGWGYLFLRASEWLIARAYEQEPLRSDRVRYLLLAVCIVLGLLASYGLARAGEPSSAWLWGLIL